MCNQAINGGSHRLSVDSCERQDPGHQGGELDETQVVD